MTDAYARAKATAARLIAAKGMSVTWSQAPAPATGGDPWNPQPDPGNPPDTPAPAPQVFTVSVVFFPTGLQSQRTLQALLGKEVPEAYEYGLMAGNVPFTPTDIDVVTRNGVVLPIVKIDTLGPAGSAVLHTVYFKR